MTDRTTPDYEAAAGEDQEGKDSEEGPAVPPAAAVAHVHDRGNGSVGVHCQVSLSVIYHRPPAHNGR